MNNKPLVSVVVPTWNREATLQRTLSSIAMSDYDNIEVIISDNASTDNSIIIINEFLAKYPFFKLIQHPENIGPVPNWLSAIQAAKGEYIKIVWSDDEIMPDTISALIDPLLNDADIAMSFCRADIHIEGRGYLKTLYDLKRSRCLSSAHVLAGFGLKVPHIPYSPGTALLRSKYISSAIIAIELFAEPCRSKAIGPDVLLMYQGVLASKMQYVHETYVVFNEDETSITKQSHRSTLNCCYDKAVLLLLTEKSFREVFVLFRLLRRWFDPRRDRSYFNVELYTQNSQSNIFFRFGRAIMCLLRVVFS